MRNVDMSCTGSSTRGQDDIAKLLNFRCKNYDVLAPACLCYIGEYFSQCVQDMHFSGENKNRVLAESIEPRKSMSESNARSTRSEPSLRLFEECSTLDRRSQSEPPPAEFRSVTKQRDQADGLGLLPEQREATSDSATKQIRKTPSYVPLQHN